MNWFLQHVPNFVDADRPEKIPFETTKDLLAIDVVNRFKSFPKFSHFAISDNLLMEVSDGGFHWWVIGYLGDPTAVDLPQWDNGKYRAKLSDGRIVELSGKDIISSCGSVLELRDGTTAENIRH